MTRFQRRQTDRGKVRELLDKFSLLRSGEPFDVGACPTKLLLKKGHDDCGEMMNTIDTIHVSVRGTLM
jgi:hypothetical protein